MRLASASPDLEKMTSHNLWKYTKSERGSPFMDDNACISEILRIFFRKDRASSNWFSSFKQRTYVSCLEVPADLGPSIVMWSSGPLLDEPNDTRDHWSFPLNSIAVRPQGTFRFGQGFGRFCSWCSSIFFSGESESFKAELCTLFTRVYMILIQFGKTSFFSRGWYFHSSMRLQDASMTFNLVGLFRFCQVSRVFLKLLQFFNLNYGPDRETPPHIFTNNSIYLSILIFEFARTAGQIDFNCDWLFWMARTFRFSQKKKKRILMLSSYRTHEANWLQTLNWIPSLDR